MIHPYDASNDFLLYHGRKAELTTSITNDLCVQEEPYIMRAPESCPSRCVVVDIAHVLATVVVAGVEYGCYGCRSSEQALPR